MQVFAHPFSCLIELAPHQYELIIKQQTGFLLSMTHPARQAESEAALAVAEDTTRSTTRG